MKDKLKKAIESIKNEIKSINFAQIVSIITFVISLIVLYKVLIIGISEVQTLYFHILFIVLWLVTAGVGILFYNTWGVSKKTATGEDGKLNQAERIALMKVHATILLAAAILVFGTTFIYYGKKSDETINDNSVFVVPSTKYTTD